MDNYGRWNLEFEEAGRALFHGMVVPGLPNAVMEVFTPEGAVEPVQLVVVDADVGGRDGAGGLEHAEKPSGFDSSDAGTGS